MKILIVDDFASVRLFHAGLLKARGHTCFPVSNGREALDLLRGQTFDLVILDLLMPEMGGEEFLEHLRAEPRHTKLPVLVITSEATHKWMHDPHVLTLCKPVVPTRLVSAVEQELLTHAHR